MTGDRSGTTNLPDAATLARQGTHALIKPRDAATLILLRRTEGRCEVLAGRRSDKHKFMPGVYVFPGGRRDPDDSRVRVAGALSAAIEAKLSYKAGSRMNATRMRALAVAALRETYEEAGLMIGAPSPDPSARLPFMPDISRLRLVARAITPPGRSRRFDTRFFAVFADEIALDLSTLRASEELENLEWIDISETGRLKMPDITLTVLADIHEMLKQSPELSFESPVPFYYMRQGKFVRETI